MDKKLQHSEDPRADKSYGDDEHEEFFTEKEAREMGLIEDDPETYRTEKGNIGRATGRTSNFSDYMNRQKNHNR